jgi:hypothetical protein
MARAHALRNGDCRENGFATIGCRPARSIVVTQQHRRL